LSTGLKNVWDKWWRISGHAATFQAKVLFTLVYFTLLAPIGILIKLLGDPLKVSPTHSASAWEERPPQEAPLKLGDLSKQY
jgi:hypothetical protein